ncbi:hypothetical protein [Pedobacter frigoris]|uniref:Uncharacterized protein n=1 Tax=Pedobacter frigoris TaxID=2571272 RepID=A0A4U1CLV3_9SPHI|nr:hypothetical protein [Pedobacter frigoris]TKC06369.1 hypothetical protein FA047_13750 [Pedobacter frigoris]
MPGDTLELFESGTNGWYRILNQGPKNKLYLFVFNQDSIKKYRNIEELAKRKQYDIVEYTEKQLEDLDWKVKINNHE